MHRTQKSAYLYIFPLFALFGVFMAYPLFDTVYLGFFDWNGFDKEKLYIGLGNYIAMFGDPVFFTAVKNYLLFAVLVISSQMILGFSLAYAMRRKSFVFTVYKVIAFLPVTILPVVTAYVFSEILGYHDGPLNSTLRAIGLDVLALGWLSEPSIAMLTLVIITVWAGTGFSMSIYASALTAFPNEVIEAAVIDGADKLQTTLLIVWPMLRSTHFSLTIIGATSAVKIFDIIYLLTRGGPNHATEMLSTYLFGKAFQTYEQGFASAVATFIILLVLVVTVIQLRMSRESQPD